MKRIMMIIEEEYCMCNERHTKWKLQKRRRKTNERWRRRCKSDVVRYLFGSCTLAFTGMRVIPTHLRSIAAVTYCGPLNEMKKKMKNHVERQRVQSVLQNLQHLFRPAFTSERTATTPNEIKKRCIFLVFPWRWCPFDILHVARVRSHSPTQMSTAAAATAAANPQTTRILARMQSRMIQ